MCISHRIVHPQFDFVVGSVRNLCVGFVGFEISDRIDQNSLIYELMDFLPLVVSVSHLGGLGLGTVDNLRVGFLFRVSYENWIRKFQPF